MLHHGGRNWQSTLVLMLASVPLQGRRNCTCLSLAG